MIRKTMAIPNIKLDRHCLIIAITQKLFAWFYLNLYPISVMKFFISHNFLFFSSSPPSVIELVQPGTCPAWPHFPLLTFLVLSELTGQHFHAKKMLILVTTWLGKQLTRKNNHIHRVWRFKDSFLNVKYLLRRYLKDLH